MSPSYSDDGASLAVLGVVYLFLFIFLVIGYVIFAFFLMKVFDKAGVQGRWRAWVPVYNSMIFAKLGDISPWIVLILAVLSGIPFLNFVTSLALAVVMALAAYRIGLKLQKEGVWVILYVLLSLVWLGINAFDKSRWNTAVAPAPWAGNFLADKTQWQGIPAQASTGGSSAPGGYSAAAGSYPPPPAPGYTAPPAPPVGTTPPPPAGYSPPPAPPVSDAPPAPGSDRV